MKLRLLFLAKGCTGFRTGCLFILWKTASLLGLPRTLSGYERLLAMQPASVYQIDEKTVNTTVGRQFGMKSGGHRQPLAY